MRASLPLLASALSLALASCLVYDESLLSGGAGGTGGDGGSGATGNQGGGGSGNQGGGGSGNQGGGGTGNQGGGGSGGCTNPTQCPGDDGDCQSRTCQGGVCGIMLVSMGTAIAAQTAGDCKKLVCDGQGNVVSQNDDGDTPNDAKQCTTDDCNLGVASNTPIGEGSPCNQSGGAVCNAAGDCVECVDGTDCASTICDAMTFTCSPASCNDMVKNGTETATDCGGSCPGCAIGQACMVASDCLSSSCVGMQCAPSCTDGLQNQTESDTDCGGTCSPCATGLNCNAGADCETGYCDGGGVCACSPVCACHLVISEIRTRGATGNDEAIELFNPLNVPVVMDDKWLIEVRSTGAGSYGPRWVGAAMNPLVIPPKGHLLIAKAAVDYTGAVPADAYYTTNSGIADAASVVLRHDGLVVDAICFGVTAGEITALAGAGYVCEGAAFDKSATQDTRTLERKPGGANGNSCTDTDSSTADFIENLTPNFQNLSSPPTP